MKMCNKKLKELFNDEDYYERTLMHTLEDFTYITIYLLNGFFKGEFEKDGQCVKCSLINGQKFKMTIEEVE